MPARLDKVGIPRRSGHRRRRIFRGRETSCRAGPL